MIGICVRPGCGQPKVPGRGSKLCGEHRATQGEEKIERRKDVLRIPLCQWPGGCQNPKRKGAGCRYCAEHSAGLGDRNRADALSRARARTGMPETEYQRKMEEQHGLCALCGGPAGLRRLSVDHDHSCCTGRTSCGQCFRDLLCDRCNPMLGYAQDDIEILEKAIAYLKRWKIIRSRQAGRTSAR